MRQSKIGSPTTRSAPRRRTSSLVALFGATILVVSLLVVYRFFSTNLMPMVDVTRRPVVKAPPVTWTTANLPTTLPQATFMSGPRHPGQISIVVPLRSAVLGGGQLEVLATAVGRGITAASNESHRVREILFVAATQAVLKNFTRSVEGLFEIGEASGNRGPKVYVFTPRLNKQGTPKETIPPSGTAKSKKDSISYSQLMAEGAYRADGQYILFLGPTHIPTKGSTGLHAFAEELLQVMLKDRSIGVVSCTAIDNKGLIVDNGQEISYGRGHLQRQATFMEKMLNGFTFRDNRAQVVHDVPYVSPYCLLTDFDGLQPAPSPAPQLFQVPPSVIDMAYLSVNGASMADAKGVDGVGPVIAGDVRAAAAFAAHLARLVESAMGDITMKEVSEGSSRLRDLVRQSYRELMSAEKRVEDSGQRGKSKALPPVVGLEMQKLELQLSGETAGKRLTILLPHLKEANTLLAEAMSMDRLDISSREVEDSTGWEIAMAAKAQKRRVVAAPVTTQVVLTSLPPTLIQQIRKDLNSVSMVSPAVELVGHRMRRLYPEFAMNHRTHAPNINSDGDPRSGNIRVLWDTFCCHCCGFVNEIVHLVVPLPKIYDVQLIQEPDCFCPGYPDAVASTIDRLHVVEEAWVGEKLSNSEILVWISHRDPGAFPSIAGLRRKPDYIIGRSMYEFTKMPPKHIEGANSHCDEIWVPAEWVRQMFISNGIRSEKLVIIPEAVDTHFFDPSIATPMALPPQEGAFRYYCNHPYHQNQTNNYKFFTNFKWEARKGWDILFDAYFSTFSKNDPVSLYILTHIWFPGGPETYGDKHNTTFLMKTVEDFAREKFGPLEEQPHFCFLCKDLEETQMVSLYAAADAFVMPTRGEGWGLPTIQAMAMGLPTISTNWGGQMEFMTQETSFMIELDGVEEIPMDSDYHWALGKKWGTPSTNQTALYMKTVFEDPEYGRAVGRRARKRIVDNFSEEAVAQVIDRRLRSVRNIVLSRR